MSLLSDADIASARMALEVLLVHRCTVTPLVAGALDGHYNATIVMGAPVTNVPCTYAVSSRVTPTARDERGVVAIQTPTLMASPTGPIEVGCLVSAITDQLGNVLAAGPLRVERVQDDTAGLGAALLPTYELRVPEVEA